MSQRLAAICLALWSFALFGQVAGPAEEARRAQELVTAGKPAEAIGIYLKLAQAYPSNPQLLLNLSIAEYMAKQFRDSISHAGAALKLKPDLMQANLFLGASYLETGDHAAALAPLEKVVAANPQDPNARLMLAEALLQSSRFREALESFKLVTAVQPENPKAWYGLGRTSDAMAREIAGSIAQTAPASAYRFAIDGDLLLEQRRMGEAFAAFRKSLAAGLALPSVYDGLAEIYTSIGHPNWAAEATRSAHETLAVEAKTPEAALYSEYLANRRQAREAYQRLDRLESFEKYLHAARLLDARGEYVEAARAWREALKLKPGNFELRSGLIHSLFRSRDYASVLDLVAALHTEQPESVDANFLYGATLLNVQNAAAAIPYLQAALKADPRFAPAHAALGQALLQSGDAKGAITHLKAGLATDEDGSTHFQLLRAYQLTGNQEEARKALAEYQSFRSLMEQRAAEADGTAITAL